MSHKKKVKRAFVLVEEILTKELGLGSMVLEEVARVWQTAILLWEWEGDR